MGQIIHESGISYKINYASYPYVVSRITLYYKKFHVTRQILASLPFATLISLTGCYLKFHCTSLYNLWPPARQTGAYPIKLTGWWPDRRWLSIVFHLSDNLFVFLFFKYHLILTSFSIFCRIQQLGIQFCYLQNMDNNTSVFYLNWKH